MKITHNKVGQNLNTSDSGKTDKVGTKKIDSLGKELTSDKTSSGSGAAQVTLSQKAQDIKKAKEIVNSVPDVDEAKVAKFQTLIDSGKYKPDSSKIADKMVDEFLMTEG